jgi:sensor domain CHASE-containing protein/HPt (histidine-containing phosphotransfer) domain-containing protein/two-component sensor histidine kinase
MVLLWGVTQRVLISGFNKVEQEFALQSISRVNATLNEMTENLELKAIDWSKWDATYSFISTRDSQFTRTTLTYDALASLKLNFIMLLDTNRNVIYSMQYYIDMDLASALSPGIRDAIVTDTMLTRHRDVFHHHSGIIIADSLPILITAQAVTSSNRKKKPNGTLIVGKILDNYEINRIQKLTHTTFQMTRFNAAGWSKLSAMSTTYKVDSTILINSSSKDTLNCYVAINDIYNKRACMLKINLPRYIYQQGRLTNDYIMLIIFLTGLALAEIIALLLNRTVTARIDKLNKDVTAIKKGSNTLNRVTVNGNDEIALFAKSVNEMLSSLESKEMIIKERNAEMQLLMNSLPIGLLSLDEHFRINPEYSSSVETMILKQNLAGNDFITTFGFDKKDKKLYDSINDYLELLIQNMISNSDIVQLNPCEEYEYIADDCTRWLQMRFFPIKRGEPLPDHILVVIENITDKKELSEQISNSESENLQLKLIAEDPDLFSELLTEISHLVDNSLMNLHSCEHNLTAEKINCIFRDVHTIKGSAGPFGLDILIGIAARVEDALAQIRETLHIDKTTSNFLQYNLSRMKNEVHKTIEILRSLFGDDFNENPDIHLRIPLERIKSEFFAFDKILMNSGLTHENYSIIRDRIFSHFVNIRLVPAKRGLAKALKTAPNIISRLQKNVSFVITGENTLIDCEIARNLNNPLIHLIRNGLDHGIENSEQERIDLGKSPQGSLLIIIVKNDTNSVTIDITDDGRGIDPDVIRTQAVVRGLITQEAASLMNDTDALALILMPGFTTTRNATEFSGRGVGMDVVNIVIKDKLGGKLSIISKKNQGTTFRITVPETITFTQ